MRWLLPVPLSRSNKRCAYRRKATNFRMGRKYTGRDPEFGPVSAAFNQTFTLEDGADWSSLCAKCRRRRPVALLQGQDRMLVEPAEIVPADFENLDPHLQAITQWIDLGPVIVRPLHRDFG